MVFICILLLTFKMLIYHSHIQPTSKCHEKKQTFLKFIQIVLSAKLTKIATSANYKFGNLTTLS